MKSQPPTLSCTGWWAVRNRNKAILTTRGPGSLSGVAKTGLMSFFLACVFFPVSPYITAAILVLFLLFAFTAPFCITKSFYLPVISRCPKGTKEVALTFDDGPDPDSTPLILDLLERHSLSATFFIIGEKAEKYPELIKAITARGHGIGNHSHTHDYALMLRLPSTIQKEIHRCQEALSNLGTRPVFFRPPVGITGPRLESALSKEGLINVNYSCRAFDRGNRSICDLARRVLKKVKPGDIIMLHDLPLADKDMKDLWGDELEFLFHSLKKDYGVASLCKLVKE
jgi:peptidoglycan-N-acetylglucosamine deacetylase